MNGQEIRTTRVRSVTSRTIVNLRHGVTRHLLKDSEFQAHVNEHGNVYVDDVYLGSIPLDFTEVEG